MKKYKIAFLAYGAMSRSISAGLNKNGLVSFKEQIISGRDLAKLQSAQKKYGLALAKNNLELAQSADTIIIGVKPHQVLKVLKEIKSVSGQKLIISIAAGVELKEMQAFIPAQAALIRVMPNVAASIAKGAHLICALPGTEAKYKAHAFEIFQSLGFCLELEENLFNQASAVSGSGPAYFFEFMEHMVRGAVRLGLSRAEARKLVIHTALGAAEMAAAKEDCSLTDLRDMVTSPGGSTAEALYIFERAHLGATVQDALSAASHKAKKLGQKDER